MYKVIDKNGNKYIENFEKLSYNMDKLMKYYKNYNEEKTKEYKYLIMLDLQSEELNTFGKGDKFMEEYANKVNKVNEDPEFQSFMTAEEDYQKCLNTDRRIAREEGHEEGFAVGHAEGHAEGREEGRAEGQKELARTLLEKGVSKELIASSLNVAVNEIEEYLK